MDDETLSSKEDLISKARKPYTITKQRERWTAEEHNRFLEAIKLYGRAWQRIEEHIGTKTAVQIRSHAQKFFTKLEKEALNKGVPLGQARDIDIPPPRPKRKPSIPYPRKTSTHTGMGDDNPLKSVSSSHSSIQIQELEKENPCRGKENFDEESSLSQETPCTSLSTSLGLKGKCVFRVEERSNADAEGNHNLDGKVEEVKQSENLCNQNYPRHIPVHVLESRSQNHSNITIQQQSVVENFPSALGQVSSNHMFVNTSFQNLIVSTLVQNPAAHAAASLAASLWPFTTNVETCPGIIEGPSPSTAAIAAATVMAASAWWAAHGLLPLCPPPPLHAGFTCIPVQTDPSPTEKNEDSKASNTKSAAVSMTEQAQAQPEAEDKGKPKEQVDRSSCGSNTASSSEVETDMLEKHGNGKDESKEHNVNRNRSVANLTESWKEVSEEGKMAFKALFSRQVLPQSFPPPKNGLGEKLQIDLNSIMTPVICVDSRGGENEKNQIEEEGLCGHGKLKARRTGFKPYKRCSMEESSNENKQGEERDAKRVCLQGEASM